MCVVHVPQHACRVGAYTGPDVVRALWLVSAVALVYHPTLHAVSDVAQRIACIHIAIHAAVPLKIGDN